MAYKFYVLTILLLTNIESVSANEKSASEVIYIGRSEVRSYRIKEILKLNDFSQYFQRLSELNLKPKHTELALFITSKFDNSIHIESISNEKRIKIEINKNGKLLLEDLPSLSKDQDAIISLRNNFSEPKITARFNLKLPIKTEINKKKIIEAVLDYQKTAEAMYGWGSFLVPNLDCLMLVYNTDEVNAGPTIKTSTGEEKIAPDMDGKIAIKLSQDFESITLPSEPTFAHGCVFSKHKRRG